MNKRLLSITVIGWIFILFGTIALLASLLSIVNTDSAHRLADLRTHWVVHLLRMAALLSGVLMLYGSNCGRWLLVVWLGLHVVVSILHTPLELVVHTVLFIVVLYFLFRPAASAYFKGSVGDSETI
jgi:hypothetical protein